MLPACLDAPGGNHPDGLIEVYLSMANSLLIPCLSRIATQAATGS